MHQTILALNSRRAGINAQTFDIFNFGGSILLYMDQLPVKMSNDLVYAYLARGHGQVH